jgi:hypothetical protein
MCSVCTPPPTPAPPTARHWLQPHLARTPLSTPVRFSGISQGAGTRCNFELGGKWVRGRRSGVRAPAAAVPTWSNVRSTSGDGEPWKPPKGSIIVIQAPKFTAELLEARLVTGQADGARPPRADRRGAEANRFFRILQRPKDSAATHSQRRWRQRRRRGRPPAAGRGRRDRWPSFQLRPAGQGPNMRATRDSQSLCHHAAAALGRHRGWQEDGRASSNMRPAA